MYAAVYLTSHGATCTLPHVGRESWQSVQLEEQKFLSWSAQGCRPNVVGGLQPGSKWRGQQQGIEEGGPEC